MALVAYDNSDISEYEDDENEVQSTGIIKENSAGIEVTGDTAEAVDATEVQENQSLFNELPLPSTKKKAIIEEDDEFLHKKDAVIKPKSKITIPSLSDFKDVDKTVPSSKVKALNGKKSGLLSMLPQPKNAVKSSIKSLIPNALAQKSQPKPSTAQKINQIHTTAKTSGLNIPKTSILTEYSDESDDDIQNDFFSINKTVDLPEDIPLDLEDKNEKVEKSPNTKSQPRSLESYFKKEEVVLQASDIEVPQASDYNYSVQNVNNTEQKSNDVLDEEAILKLCGARGKRKREEIQIVDVNQQEVLNDAREWLLKGLMDDTTKRQSASKKKGNEPTTQQKRKHQITYLAHQAKANEAELQNQWANNRMTKRQTQSKYGF